MKTKILTFSILLPFLTLALLIFQNCSGDSAFVMLPEQANEQAGVSSQASTEPPNEDSLENSSFNGSTNPVGNNKVTETFIQEANIFKKADIVWVVDDSGSMNNVQNNLAGSFEFFIGSFIELNIDYKMRIITTDLRNTKPGNKGTPIITPRFHPDSGIDCSEDLNKNASDINPEKLIDDFKKCVNVGTSGSGAEKGLEASKIYAQNYSGWFRADAQKVFIYVSDEEDTSAGTVQSYYDELIDVSITGIQAEKLSTYAITCTVPAIPSVCYENQVGSRYIEMSQMTGGSVADMNQTPNFFTILSGIGAQIIELLNGYELTNHAIPGTIEVTVDNQIVPATHYQYANKKVTFFEQYIPEVNAQIEIRYEIADQ